MKLKSTFLKILAVIALLIMCLIGFIRLSYVFGPWKDTAVSTAPTASDILNQTSLSLLENDRVEIGKRRAEQLAKAFDVHPAIIMLPEYEAKEIQKAS